jgi:acyl carrier protein
MDVADVVRAFIIESFLFGDENGFNDHTSLTESGIVDSTGMLELVEFIEGTFGIRMQDEELIPENLDCIARVEKYVREKLK